MGLDYDSPEEAIRQILISNTAFDLTEDTCGVDLDSIMAGLVNSGTRYSCLLSFAGASKQPRETFNTGTLSGGKGNKWVMRCFGVLFIRLLEDGVSELEIETRKAIKALGGLLEDDRRLGGTVPFSDVIGIDTPEVATINDIPFYMLGFSIEMWAKT